MRAPPVLQKTRVIGVFLVLIIGKSFDFVQLSAKGIFRRSLQHRIQCRIDAIPLAFYGLKTDLPLHLLAYQIDCVGLRNNVCFRLDDQRLTLCFVGDLLWNLIFLDHSSQNEVPLLGGRLEIAPG
jgi:hypothetical protein